MKYLLKFLALIVTLNLLSSCVKFEEGLGGLRPAGELTFQA